VRPLTGVLGIINHDPALLDLLALQENGFVDYMLNTSIGPIREYNPTAFNQFVDIPTTSGLLTLNNISYVDFQATASPVPIPGAVWLLGSGLIGLVGLRRKFFRK
jgi:hypothetical protein